MTNAEKKLRNSFLKTYSYKFYRQRPIDHFIVDFYCAKAALVVEIDWDSHFTDEWKEYDKMRTEILWLYNLHILRFTNDEVYNNFEWVCQIIDGYIKEHIPPLVGEVSEGRRGE